MAPVIDLSGEKRKKVNETVITQTLPVFNKISDLIVTQKVSIQL